MISWRLETEADFFKVLGDVLRLAVEDDVTVPELDHLHLVDGEMIFEVLDRLPAHVTVALLVEMPDGQVLRHGLIKVETLIAYLAPSIIAIIIIFFFFTFFFVLHLLLLNNIITEFSGFVDPPLKSFFGNFELFCGIFNSHTFRNLDYFEFPRRLWIHVGCPTRNKECVSFNEYITIPTPGMSSHRDTEVELVPYFMAAAVQPCSKPYLQKILRYLAPS